MLFNLFFFFLVGVQFLSLFEEFLFVERHILFGFLILIALDTTFELFEVFRILSSRFGAFDQLFHNGFVDVIDLRKGRGFDFVEFHGIVEVGLPDIHVRGQRRHGNINHHTPFLRTLAIGPIELLHGDLQST